MQTKIITTVAFSIILAVSLFSSACDNRSQITQASNQSTANSSVVEKTDKDKKVKKINCQNPIIIGSDFDQSGSMKWSGNPATTTDDLKPLLKLIATCGGEIGVTFVRHDSAKPIERLRVEEPPPPIAEIKQKTNEEDYEFADRMDEYNQKVAEREQELQKNRKTLEPQINEYLQTLAPLLANKPQGGTDLWTSRNRLDIFLSEGNDSWNTKPHRYLLVVSDGMDSIGKEKHPFKSDATVIWVNANASEKNLKDFPYQRVESFSAAVKIILAREGGK